MVGSEVGKLRVPTGLLIQNFHVLGFSHAVGEELVTAGGELCAIHPPWAEHVV